ncbi:MAG: glycosyltransferase family 2 protein [Patescibacteria group bacterium]
MKLSIIICAFNEKNTIQQVVDTVKAVDLGLIEKEIIIVDDGSTDGTRDILKGLEDSCKVIYHEKNKGKGGAMKTGLKVATGDMMIIQDADLEYSPTDYPALMKPIIDGKVDMVLGVRDVPKFGSVYQINLLGNNLITWTTNLFYGRRAKEYLGGYKVFSKRVTDAIEVKTDDFDFDTELVCKAWGRGYKSVEVPIKYNPRSYKEGKKINMKHGLIILWTTIKYRFIG